MGRSDKMNGKFYQIMAFASQPPAPPYRRVIVRNQPQHEKDPLD